MEKFDQINAHIKPPNFKGTVSAFIDLRLSMSTNWLVVSGKLYRSVLLTWQVALADYLMFQIICVCSTSSLFFAHHKSWTTVIFGVTDRHIFQFISPKQRQNADVLQVFKPTNVSILLYPVWTQLDNPFMRLVEVLGEYMSSRVAFSQISAALGPV